MSICINKKRKQYYISYQVFDEATQKYKTYYITNAKWTLSLGKKYIKSIEQEEILKDKRKRLLRLSKRGEDTFEDVINSYILFMRATLKVSTAYAHTHLIQKYISPNFSIEKPTADALTTKSLEQFRAFIQASPISREHANRILQILKDIIQYAIEREYLNIEYGTKLTYNLKKVNTGAEVKEKLKYWTNEEWDKFYSTFKDTDKYKMLFRVCYECALRLGELQALTWEDVDFERRVISINKTIDTLGNITRPKTASSEAEVSISVNLANDLAQYKKDLASESTDFIFFGRNHSSRTTIRRVMYEHIKEANVPQISPHGLRHSCASRMINAGCDALLVSKHLRHASTQMTLDTYSHLFPNRTKGLIDSIF